MKIRGDERLEPPHVTILWRTTAWRYDIRHCRVDMMSDQKLFVVSEGLSSMWRRLPGERIRTGEELYRVYTARQRYSRADLWFSDQPDLFRSLGNGREARGSQHRLLVFGSTVPSERREFLSMWFRTVDVTREDRSQAAWLPGEELVEALGADNRDELVIRARVDAQDRVVLLLRGNLERIAVPGDWFTRRETPHRPDFSKVRPYDYGHTLELGAHDVAVDSILYDFDPEARRRMKARELQLDDSFGGALRRLRLHRGLSQSDFSPVSARQIRRIESGETESPREKTLKMIANRLGVEPEEIASY